MKNTLILLALTLFSYQALAEPIKIYGQINVSAQSSDEGEGRFSELKSNNSRFGLKGDYALDGDLTLVYQLEWGVNVSDSSSSNVTARNQFLGLKGNFGEVRLGRHDTALKMSQGKIDLFNDFEGDLTLFWGSEIRANNSVSYFSPTYNGFGAQVTYILEDSADGEDGASIGLFYGDDGLKETNFYVAAGFDSDVSGYDSMRLNAQTKVGQIKLGAMFQQQEYIETGDKRDGWLVSASYPHNKLEFKVQYQTMEDDDAISAGMDYKAGKSTSLFVWYTTANFERPTPDKNYLGLGIKHVF